jgi:hypothetical protein
MSIHSRQKNEYKNIHEASKNIGETGGTKDTSVQADSFEL